MTNNLNKYLLASLQDKPFKLALDDGSKKPKDFFMVIGSKSPRLKRAIATWGVTINENLALLEKEEMSVDKVLRANELREDAERILAIEMIDSHSFDGATDKDIDKLLIENVDLVSAVVSASFDAGNYTEKK